MKAYIIHENEEWSLPLKEQLQKLSVPFEDWHMAKVLYRVNDWLYNLISWVVLQFDRF